ncbi:IS1 family transposase [uncultured Psychroserpens sp.]|uniref:IS1 family transposase n=1 Tax=uncultured Psychroserpens sp. TaxID=255436 RepID=UPI00260B8D96|nr:IS1 family transposase [uncultured Psychroserpens sp.]
MENIKCPKCIGLSVKSGFQNNVQRYKCKSCNKRFQLEYSYKAYNSDTNDLIKNLLKEGSGIRSISRILKISKNTVLSRLLKISKEIKSPCFHKLGCKFEVDELWSFIGNKDSVIWITYAIEQQTKTVIDFIVGRKTSENIKPLINKLLLLVPKRIYTDRLNIYTSIIPRAIHKRFQYCTNIIERNNLTLRTHIKRLSRKTICFSKNEKYLEAHLRIYFWG